MPNCIICDADADDQPFHATIYSGARGQATVVGVERWQPGRITYNVDQSYFDVKEHSVYFCKKCWGRDLRFFRIGIGCLLLPLISLLVGFLLVFVPKNGEGPLGHYDWLGFVIPLLLLFGGASLIWLMRQMGPVQRSLEIVATRRKDDSPGSLPFVAFKGKWPNRNRYQQYWFGG